MLKLKKKRKYVKPPVTDFYKIRREHDVFITMLNMFATQNPEQLQVFINNQWKINFPSREFPQKGVNLQKVKVALQYQIIFLAHQEYGIEITDKFLSCREHAINYLSTDTICKVQDKIEQSAELSKIIIYPLNQGDIQMAVKKKVLNLKKKATPKKKKAVAPKKKAVVKKKTTEKRAAPVADNKIKPSTFYFCTELLKRKFTDAEILRKVREKTGKGLDSGYVPYCRKRLNAGIQKGFDKASPAIKEVKAK